MCADCERGGSKHLNDTLKQPNVGKWPFKQTACKHKEASVAMVIDVAICHDDLHHSAFTGELNMFNFMVSCTNSSPPGTHVHLTGGQRPQTKNKHVYCEVY